MQGKLACGKWARALAAERRARTPSEHVNFRFAPTLPEHANLLRTGLLRACDVYVPCIAGSCSAIAFENWIGKLPANGKLERAPPSPRLIAFQVCAISLYEFYTWVISGGSSLPHECPIVQFDTVFFARGIWFSFCDKY